MSDQLLVGTRKGLFRIEKREGSWRIGEPAFLGDPVSQVLPDPRDGTFYACLELGHFGAKLQRSDDGGESWEEVAAPAFPDDSAEAGKRESDEARPPSVGTLWCLEAGGPDVPGQLWMGTTPGGLFVSRDRGESWELVRSLWDLPARREWFGGGKESPGIHSICVDPGDSRHVTIGVSCGGVWTTRDRGETWENRSKGMFAEYMPPERREDPNIQDPHRVVNCVERPEHFWAQHHNGIFRSTDDLASWTEVEGKPSSFGFAVSVHPRDPDTAWFVPAVKDECRVPVDAKLVVSRTRDGGASFEILSEGLPRESAYDLVYRHAMDIDSSGERLAIGSTTGSLWITEDQGDSWIPVTRHLPPVYTVRFQTP